MAPAAARVGAGLDRPAAAKKLRISESTLRQCERHGPTLLVMGKMGRLYQFRIDDLVKLRENPLAAPAVAGSIWPIYFSHLNQLCDVLKTGC